MVKSQAFRLVPSLNEFEMVPRLEQRLLHEIVRALLVAAQRYGERAQATHFAYEGISQARRDFAGQLFVSASLKILQQP